MNLFAALAFVTALSHALTSEGTQPLAIASRPAHCFFAYVDNAEARYEKTTPNLWLICEAHPPRGECYYEVDGRGSMPATFQDRYCSAPEDTPYYANSKEIERVQALESPDVCRYSALESRSSATSKMERVLNCAQFALSRGLQPLGDRAGYEYYLIVSKTCKGEACKKVRANLEAYRKVSRGKTITGDSFDGGVLSAEHYTVDH